MIEYDENGRMILRRSINQNRDYFRNVVGQCVFWHNHKFQNKIPDKKLAEIYHMKFKKNVLKPIFNLTSDRDWETH